MRALYGILRRWGITGNGKLFKILSKRMISSDWLYKKILARSEAYITSPRESYDKGIELMTFWSVMDFMYDGGRIRL